MMFGRLVLGILLSVVGVGAPAHPQDFYRGKQINFVVSVDPGSSYDTFARMVSRRLPAYIAGEPSVVVRNMPGAGGLRAANYLYSVAPKDGLTIGMINNTLPFDPLYGNKAALFDSAKFNWLGSPSQETALLILWHTVPIDKLADAKTRELILAATGAGSTPAFFARVLSSLFGLKVRIIPGYKSQTEAFLAMERGENDGHASPFWSSLKAEVPQLLAEKKIKPIVYYGARTSEISVPHALDLLQGAEERAVMEIAQSALQMGRPIVAPPDIDKNKIAILRRALASVFKDPTYLAECAQANLYCGSPSTGEEIAALVQKIYASPRPAIDRITAIYMEGQQR